MIIGPRWSSASDESGARRRFTPNKESAGINVIVGRREGLLAWGARTLSSDRSHAGISTTRTVTALGTFVRDLTSWAAFERSDVRTWNRLHGVVATALEGLRKRGAFAGETAADAYYVKADAEVNVPELAASGRIKVEFGFGSTCPETSSTWPWCSRAETSSSTPTDPKQRDLPLLVPRTEPVTTVVGAWRRFALLSVATASVVGAATGVGDRAEASARAGVVELGAGAERHRFTLRRPAGVVLLFRLTLPRGTRAHLTGRLGSIAGVGMSTASADCRLRGETLVCEQGVEWCPLPRGAWAFNLRKLSGPGGTARLEFGVGRPPGRG